MLKIFLFVFLPVTLGRAPRSEHWFWVLFATEGEAPQT